MNWFRDLKVGNKLVAFGVAATICIIGIAGLGYKGVTDANAALKELHDEHLVALTLTANMSKSIYQVRFALMSMAAAAEKKNREIMEKQHSVIKEVTMEIDANLQKNIAKEWGDDGEMKKNINALSAKWVEFRDTRDNELIPYLFDGRVDEAKALANGIQAERFNAMIKIMDEFNGTEQAEVTELVAHYDEESNRFLWIGAAIITFSIFMTAGFVGLMVKNIAAPIAAMVSAIKEVAQGDFTREVPHTSGDEIGVMGETFNGMVEELRGMFTDIRQNSKTLAVSSEELSAVSTQLSASSEQMSQQTGGVASATEQMSANINSMAAAVEEASVNATTVSGTAEHMSANMHSIAAAVEEMSYSIREVAKSTGETCQVAGEAMGLSKTASDTMQSLGAAANEIGKVTAMIKRIAEQTNLLALNATIEAASAGEAGRGFAVVANEIKELANQSAHAAEEIAAKIEGVRGSAANAVRVISDVSEIIGKINASVEAITGAMNRQTDTANEISRNVAEVSQGAVDIAGSIAEVAKGAADISRNSGEAARGANDVSTNIQGISKAVVDNNAGIQQIHASSGELAKIAGILHGMVAKFRVETDGGSRQDLALRENIA